MADDKHRDPIDRARRIAIYRQLMSAIVHLVRQADPGCVVVVHGVRPRNALVNGRRIAPDHYFCIVKPGAPQDDAFWADCSFTVHAPCQVSPG